MLRCLVPLAATTTLLQASPANASITVTINAQRPALRVDARGYAEVSWTAQGARRKLLVPPRGRVLPGARIVGRDVSRSTTLAVIPFRRVLRRTPDGRLWALQAWRPQKGGPVELRFSRWRGAPTRVELAARPVRRTAPAALTPRYRAVVAGPNWGTTYAPDGAATAISSLS